LFRAGVTRRATILSTGDAARAMEPGDKPRGDTDCLFLRRANWRGADEEPSPRLRVLLQPGLDEGDGAVDDVGLHSLLRRDGLHQAVGALDVRRPGGQRALRRTAWSARAPRWH